MINRGGTNIRKHILWNALSGTLLCTLALMLVTLTAESLYAGSKLGRTMTTVQYNNQRTGWNPDEDILTIETVNPDQFGKIWTAELVGQIYGSALYISGVNIGGKTRNAIYVGTEANLIYALDADTGEQLWVNDSLGIPGSRSFLLCGNISPDIGITGTPVIDIDPETGTGTLYAVGLTRQGSIQRFKMAAVDIETGKSIDGWPVTIDPQADIPLDTRVTSERGALLLANGMVYVPFGGYAGDCGNYHGWVVGVDKEKPDAPQISYHTPAEGGFIGSGLWASAGIAADKEGNLYPVTGNSLFGPRGRNFNNSVLRLRPDLTFSEEETDFFTPSNTDELDPDDKDLGSVAALILPPQEKSNTPNMIFVAGKKAVGHLLDRDDRGGVAQGDGENNEGIFSLKLFNRNYNTAVYYEDPDEEQPTIFVAGRGQGEQPGCEDTVNGVVALALEVDADGNSFYRSRWCTPSMGLPPINPQVTSAKGRTGILWVLDRQLGPTRLVLHAFNASTGEELYNSDMVEGDGLGEPATFLMHFTVIDGKAFVGDRAGNVVAFGLRKK